MYSIENNFLKISIKEKGAELTSLFNKEKETEMLWQGNPEYWAGQAPILFPIVGELKNGEHIHENEKYAMYRHGFVRKSNDWKIEKLNDTTITCTFKSNTETLAQFPYPFKLIVRYHISKKTLQISHHITNTGDTKMPVSIGGHPAFDCPVNSETSYSDYYLKFDEIENSDRHLLDEKGLFNGKTEACLQNTDILKLNDTIFNNDALVFKDLKSEKITLYGPSGEMLSVSYPYFPFMGIWSKPKAPYVCIEPWIGHADTADSDQNLFSKEGSLVLKPNQEYTATYNITLA